MASVYIPHLDAFELHHQLREQDNSLQSSGQLRHVIRSAKDGLAGSAGASISNVMTYPLDLIITRLQIQRQFRKNADQGTEEEYTGLIDAAQKIYKKDGIAGFFAGVLSDTGKTIADSFIFFLLYDYLRRARLHRHNNARSLPAHEELGVGFIAGATTKLLTTPIANLVTRQQAAAFSEPNTKTPSVVSIANKIRAEQGLSGFWSGYSASLVLTLNPSLTFFLFEFLKRIALPKSRRDSPPASVTFLLAALSKACASSVTYPFSLTKARLQAGSVQNKEEEKREDKEVDKNISSDNKEVQKLEKKAIRKTLLSTLLTIYETEGTTALYEGLHLEILKAFISHGITMTVKQSMVHLISRLSYAISLVLSNPTRATRQASKLAERAKDKSVEYYDLSIKRVNEKVQEATDAAKTKAYEVAEFVSEYVEDEEGTEVKELYGTTGLSKWLDERWTDGEK